MLFNLKNIFILSAFLSILPFINAQSQDWELTLDKDAVKVFTRSIDGYQLKEYRAQVEVQASIDKVLTVLQDYANYPNWSHNCTEGKLLKEEGDTHYIYMVNDAPWPVNDRDIVARNTYTQKADGSYEITVKQVDEEMAPKEKNKVRIPFFKGKWLLEPIDAQTIKVTQEGLADPGGSIPAWLANMTVEETPYKSMLNLKTQLEKP